MNTEIQRCWKTKNPLYLKYHDEEWGVPIHDDRLLFEFLVLGGFQAGLTWELILKRRDAFRFAFDNFDPKKMANYNEKKMEQLMHNSLIIRNRQKILSAVNNAKRFLEIKKDQDSFNQFIWSFIPSQRTGFNAYDYSDLPVETNESKKMSEELKKKGFTFVGPKICYAFMQAVGIVNDHLIGCFRSKEINRNKFSK